MSTSSPNTAPQGEPTTPLSAERLAEIRERAAAATPGPWCTDGWEIYQGTEYLAGAVWIGETCDTSDTAKSVADAEFIGHAREDVPALLTEVDRLRGELAAAMKHGAVLVTEVKRLRAESGDF